MLKSSKEVLPVRVLILGSSGRASKVRYLPKFSSKLGENLWYLVFKIFWSPNLILLWSFRGIRPISIVAPIFTTLLTLFNSLDARTSRNKGIIVRTAPLDTLFFIIWKWILRIPANCKINFLHDVCNSFELSYMTSMAKASFKVLT